MGNEHGTILISERNREQERQKSNFLRSGSVVYVTAVRNCTKGFIKKYSLFIYLFIWVAVSIIVHYSWTFICLL